MNFFNILEYGDIEEASIDARDGMESTSDVKDGKEYGSNVNNGKEARWNGGQ